MNDVSQQRHGQQGADDTADNDPGGDRQQHRQQVQLDRATEQERLQHVALDLHHRDDPGEHDQRLHPAECDQRNYDRHETGDERADQRDKAPMKTSAASAGATGTPRISATISTPMASTRTTRIVART